MRDAARDAGTVCVLDSVFPWQPAHREIKQMLERGEVGRPIAVHARLFISHFAAPDGGGQGWKWFGVRKHGASAMRNLGTHSLILLTWLLGPVQAVTAQMTIANEEWRFPDGSVQRPEVEDTAQLMLQFASGAMGVLTLGWSSPAKTGWYMELTGEQTTVVTTDKSGFPCGPRLKLSKGVAGRPLETVTVASAFQCTDDIHFDQPPSVPQAYDIACAVKDMVRVIRHGGSPLPSFEDAYHVEAVLHAAHRAAISRKWIAIDRA